MGMVDDVTMTQEHMTNEFIITLEIKFSMAVFAWSISLWPWTVFWFIEAEVSKTKHKSGIVLQKWYQITKKSNKFFF